MVSIAKPLKICAFLIFLGIIVLIVLFLFKEPEKFDISAEKLNDNTAKLTFHIDKDDTLFLISINSLYNPSWFTWRCSELESNTCLAELKKHAEKSNIKFIPPNTMIIPKRLLTPGVTNILAWSFKKGTFFSSTAFCFKDKKFYSITDLKGNYLELKDVCDHPRSDG